MAGDWIKFEKATLDKPEVFEMAGNLNLDPDAVVGKLLRVWNWFDDQSIDGNAPVTVRPLLDRYAGVTTFTNVMEKVGWLIIDGETMSLPNFNRHNGQTAKDRALTAKRVSKSRSKSNGKCNASTVTKTLPEKRREEKKLKRGDKVKQPSESEFVQYLIGKLPDISPDWTEDRAKRAASSRYETYTANGWKDGNGKAIKNWKVKATNAIKFEKPWSYGTTPKNNGSSKTNNRSGNTQGVRRSDSSSNGQPASAGEGINVPIL